MTGNKRTSSRLRQAARERMTWTGEKYTTALQAVIDGTPLPASTRQSDLATPPADPPAGEATQR